MHHQTQEKNVSEFCCTVDVLFHVYCTLVNTKVSFFRANTSQVSALTTIQVQEERKLLRFLLKHEIRHFYFVVVVAPSFLTR